MNTKYEEIYDSIINGQFKQFVSQFDDLDCYEKTEVINYISYELGQADLMLRAIQAYFNIKAR